MFSNGLTDAVPAERYVHVGDVALNIAEWPGGGPTTLLIHGWGGSWQVWDTVAPHFAGDFHVIAVDLRGFGRSGRTQEGHWRMVWVEDTVRLLERVAPEGAVVIGHSLGGWVSLMAASEAPQLVKAVVAEDPFTGDRSLVGSRSTRNSNLGRDHEADARFIESAISIAPVAERIAAENPRYSRELSEKLAVMQFRTDPRLIRSRARRSGESKNFDEAFSQVQAPVLLMQANPEKGGIMPDEEATRVKALIPGSRLVSWPHTGHNMHIARNFDFVKAVREFLEGV
jgi:pimeloyl-ACP methyl ester carboxylesterase